MTLSTHVMKFSIYMVKHHNYIEIFEDKKGYRPRLTSLGILGNDLKIPQSILVDYNTIYYRNCDVFVKTGSYNRIQFDDIEHLHVDRQQFKVLLNLTKYTRIAIQTADQSLEFFILNTTDKRHELIKSQLQSIFQRHQNQKREQNHKFNTLVFWDYDNVSLNSKTEFESDGIAKQIKQTLDELRPVDELICMSAKPVYNEEVVKIQSLAKEFQILRVPIGDDSVDQALNREIERRYGTQPNHVVIISGDHFYEETVKHLNQYKIPIYLISYYENMSNGWSKIVDEDCITILEHNHLTVNDEDNTTERVVGRWDGHSDKEPGEHNVSEDNRDTDKLDSENEDLSFTCSICQSIFGSEQGLEAHMNSNTKKHKDKFLCGLCQEILNSSQLRDQHQITTHGNVKCDLCPRTFKEIAYRDRHTQTTTKHKSK